MIIEAFDKYKSIFIPFIMAGHPDQNSFIKVIMALTEVGSDVIEIGLPFSDPIADGHINQRAAEIAIKNGMNLDKLVKQVHEVRQLGCKTPIILFSYLNPIIAFGFEKFCEKAKIVGINGILIVDLPPEEWENFYNIAKKNELEIVLLVSPTTDPARLPFYVKLKPSFIYYISRLSVTGIQKNLSNSLEQEIFNLRKNLTNTKISVGFGISSVTQAKFVSNIADGVIIGSKLVSTLELYGIDKFKNTARELADAIHGNLCE